MFYVEHFRFSSLFIAILLFFSACEKRDEAPELKDPIYIDMNSQLAAAEKSANDARLKILEGTNELNSAIPQTGQTKQAQKKIFQAEKLKAIYEQQIKYWKIRIIERAKQARVDYNKAFVAKEKWPKAEEYERYLSEKRLRLANIQWDAKSRLDDYKKSFQDINKATQPSGGGDSGGGH